MTRVAVAVRSRSLRAALERGLGERPSVIVVPLPVGGSVPRALEADIVLVDLVDWSRERATEGGRPAAIVLTEAPDDALVAATLREGARGVLSYDAGVAEVTAAIEAVAAGLVVAPASARSALAARSSRPEPGASLTEREREVLALLAAGLPNRAIGARLGISEHTVKTYVAAILDELDAATRAEAVAIGLRRGLIML
ncbi:MAG TPA: response regulator transcription factor [Gemmatimonadales bacterium]|nr:response regulator transcription factor [Gemmatimonadales bacterium]